MSPHRIAATHPPLQNPHTGLIPPHTTLPDSRCSPGSALLPHTGTNHSPQSPRTAPSRPPPSPPHPSRSRSSRPLHRTSTTPPRLQSPHTESNLFHRVAPHSGRPPSQVPAQEQSAPCPHPSHTHHSPPQEHHSPGSR